MGLSCEYFEEVKPKLRFVNSSSCLMFIRVRILHLAPAYKKYKEPKE